MTDLDSKPYLLRVGTFLFLALIGWGMVGLKLPGWWGLLGGSLAIGATGGLWSVIVPLSALIRFSGARSYWVRGGIFIAKDLVLAGVLIASLHFVESNIPLQEPSAIQIGVGGLIALSLPVIYAEPMRERRRAIFQ
ncbi:hypothetical protein [Thiohalorhabdus methylotrophus]|uniref:Uncharacterized protein n=1 Tax=Thiohalorhabdus methylotrophus TaxID=3242694 RepID=A0ABV4U0P4_9GAMM